MKLNREFIENQWIPALRSGDYKQARHRLRNALDEMCCLGVACALLVKDGVGEWSTDTDGGFTYSVEEFESATALPAPAQQYIGIGGGGGVLVDSLPFNYQMDSQSANNLMTLNDDWKYTFNQIADELQSLLDAHARVTETALAL